MMAKGTGRDARSLSSREPGSVLVVGNTRLIFTSMSVISTDLPIHAGKDHPGPVPEFTEDHAVIIAVLRYLSNLVFGELFLPEISTLASLIFPNVI